MEIEFLYNKYEITAGTQNTKNEQGPLTRIPIQYRQVINSQNDAQREKGTCHLRTSEILIGLRLFVHSDLDHCTRLGNHISH